MLNNRTCILSAKVGCEFVGEEVFNLTRGDEPYFVGYVGQH